MVMTFTFTLLSHYNSITESCTRFLLSLLEDLSIDFSSHFITSILDVYLDTTTRNKLIFPLAITQILRHFSIPILSSPYFTTVGAISVGSVWWSEAQLQLKRPRTETINPAIFAVPTSSLVVSVTLEAIMAWLQQMEADFGARLDYLTDDMCQINTQVGRIARQKALLGGFVPSLEASTNEDDDASDDEDDASDDEDDDASSFSDDKLMTSQ